MRVIETKAYQFDELSDEAKEQAYQNFLNSDREYFWMDDNLESLKQGLNHFGFHLQDWSISYHCATNAYLDIRPHHDEEIEEMSGVRLRTYILNNYYWDIYQYKTLHFCRNEDGTRRMNCVGANGGKYVSNIQIENSSCPFTGYCMDENFLGPIREFIAKPTEITFKELMEDCAHEVMVGIKDDYEYQNSEEYFIEECEANQIEFTEEGTQI